MKLLVTPTLQEISLGERENIVTKTDLAGRITYANRAFMRVANFSEGDLIGKQHNLVRHPDMPRGLFKLLWDTLKQGQEFFGYIKNITADGHFYWVFSNITHDHDAGGKHIGYFSVRRKAKQPAVDILQPIYQEMLETERSADPAHAPDVSAKFLQQKMALFGTTYDKFVLSL